MAKFLEIGRMNVKRGLILKPPHYSIKKPTSYERCGFDFLKEFVRRVFICQ